MNPVFPIGSPGGSSMPRTSFAILEQLRRAEASANTTDTNTVDTASGEQTPSMPRALTPLVLGPYANNSPKSPAPKKQKMGHAGDDEHEPGDSQAIDKLLAKIAEQEAILKEQQESLNAEDQSDSEPVNKDQETSSDGSVPITPASEAFDHVGHHDAEDDTVKVVRPASDVDELARLKRELDAAKNQIARMDEELVQTRITRQSVDQVLRSPSDASVRAPQVSDRTISQLQETFNASARASAERAQASMERVNSWGAYDDNHSEMSDALPAPHFNRGVGIWGNPPRPNYQGDMMPSPNMQAAPHPPSNWPQDPTRGPYARGPGNNFPPPPPPMSPHLPRPILAPQPQGFVPDLRTMNQMSMFTYEQQQAYRRSQAGQIGRFNGGGPYNQRNLGWGGYPNNLGMSGMSESPSPIPQPIPAGSMYPGSAGYQPTPIGTPLSPTAPEFRFPSGRPNQCNMPPPSSPAQTYVSACEPLNYRRMLERNVSGNWNYIVDKIICNNDQQASIFLQQKLKVGTNQQRFEIIEAIVQKAYLLMINRFGNFLVQRCFEHGTPAQIVAIAKAIRGNTLTLSMDSFGCHVVQKAFDCVPEEYKAAMVHELLRKIPETVVHRYACHVWQKLFELRWNDAPPQIMSTVNQSLQGMWQDVALGETGSLVVQNIFENCLEEDKRPCINEVLAGIDIVARGQFGNWCIQHICEQGQPADRSRAIEHVLRHAVSYSMDQFASKVVEKCLKIGGPDFLERYLDRVCEGRPDRPRIPLIDIASDQYGNYLIQYILTHSNPQHRELVASHIRKHMVSLRGSKFGSKVGMLCCNPASTTRPGPGVGPTINRYMLPRYGPVYR